MGCLESKQRIPDQPLPNPRMEKKDRIELLRSASNSCLPGLDAEFESSSIRKLTFDELFQQSQDGQNEKIKKGLEELGQVRDSLRASDSRFHSAYLYRFLRARNFEIKKASQMFQNHLHWRSLHSIDNILQDFTFWESNEVQQIYPHGYHKTDKDGRPVYYEILSGVTFDKLYKITTQERMKQHYYQIYEQLINTVLPGASQERNQFISQTITIIDAKNVQLKLTEAKSFFQLVNSFSQDNYPDIMGKLYVVNSPFLAQAFWKIISIVLNDTIRNKIKFLGKDYKETLLQQIDQQNLPDFLGGESNTQTGMLLRKNIGPWNNFGQIGLFPHDDEQRIQRVSKSEKELLNQQIAEFWSKKQEIKEKAKDQNCAKTRASSVKAESAIIESAKVLQNNQNSLNTLKEAPSSSS